MKDNQKAVGKPSKELMEQVLLAMREELMLTAAQLPQPERERSREIMEFRVSIIEETDRGAVLMAAAFLDDKLKELIKKEWWLIANLVVGLLILMVPLGTFSSRIDLAYLIGIIPKNAHKDLHTIRGIRNKFAHQASPLNYEDEKVKPLCEKLVFHGVKEIAECGSKFRRSVMALLSFIIYSIDSTQHIEAVDDYAIPSRTDAYKTVSEMYTKITGMEYPLKHEHE